MIDVPQVQVGGHPARQQQHLTGHRSRDIGVAIAVTAHPRGKADRRRFQRQAQPSGVEQGLVGLAQVIGNGLPQRMLDHREPPLGLVHRGRASTADFLGVPGLGDQALQTILDLRALGAGQVAMVLGGQLPGDGVVFLDQGAARHFRGVRSQYQFDFQASQLTGQGIGRMPLGPQALQQLRQDPGLERRRLRLVTPVDQLVLLGDVGQVEELVEGPGYRQQFILGQGIETGAQLGSGGAAAIGLGRLANLLDLVEKPLPVLIADGVAQQLPQEVDVFAQARINIGHRGVLQQTMRQHGRLKSAACMRSLASMGRAGHRPSAMKLVSRIGRTTAAHRHRPVNPPPCHEQVSSRSS